MYNLFGSHSSETVIYENPKCSELTWTPPTPPGNLINHSHMIFHVYLSNNAPWALLCMHCVLGDAPDIMRICQSSHGTQAVGWIVGTTESDQSTVYIAGQPSWIRPYHSVTTSSISLFPFCLIIQAYTQLSIADCISMPFLTAYETFLFFYKVSVHLQKSLNNNENIIILCSRLQLNTYDLPADTRPSLNILYRQASGITLLPF